MSARGNLVRKYAKALAEHQRKERECLILRRQFALAEEEEQRHVARQLHDRVAQQLTALSLGLKALSDLATPESEMSRLAAELRLLVNTMGQELHAIAVRLRSQALDDFGLAAAIEAYASRWSTETGIALELRVRIGAARLSSEVETAVYRIIQEALTDVVTHSGAGGASLVVERRDGTLCAAIAHDGRGFDTEALSRPEAAPGRGLPAIRQRIALLGGSTDVESAPGAGTTLSIRIPLNIMSPDAEP